MGIRVECPHGHVFKVKDKYAGKKGLCPQCEGQVIVLVPDAISTDSAEKAYRKAVLDEHRAAHPVQDAAASVLDDQAEPSADQSGSMLGSSVIRHRVKCTQCGEPVPMWFAKCPACGEYLDHL